MTIKTSSLKAFASYADAIETSTLIPILSYWYVGNGKMIKNNLKQFVSMELDVEGEFLVEEKSILAFVNSPHPEIILTEKDNRIFITDGETKIYSATDDVKHFPVLPKHTGAGFNISPEDSINIGKAAACTLQDDIIPQKCHIYVGAGYVLGTDGLVMYAAKSDLPEIALSKQVATVIGKMDECYYRQSESFHFLEHGEVVYGFSKDEANFFNATRLLEYNKESDFFIIEKDRLVSFNSLCIQLNRTKIPAASFKITNGKILFSMNQAEYSNDVEREYDIDASDSAQFTYNPTLMNKLLKTVSDEKIKVYLSGETKINIEGSDWVGLVMGIKL